jgi:hypothetical protein
MGEPDSVSVRIEGAGPGVEESRSESLASVSGSPTLFVAPTDLIPGEVGVFARRRFTKGSVLYTVEGPVSSIRTRYTFQCGPAEHIDPRNERGEPTLGHFTNHSCLPNAYIGLVERDRRISIDVVARVEIGAAEEILLDYGAMEYEIENPVRCLCRSAVCRGRITGFRTLPVEVKTAYRSEGMIPGYLLALDVEPL